MVLNKENARSFNNSLKQVLTNITGQKVRVSIINSYNFPKNCWVQVLPEKGGVFTNEFRLSVFDACKFDRKSLLNVDNVCYGNIRSNMISAHVSEWENLVKEL